MFRLDRGEGLREPGGLAQRLDVPRRHHHQHHPAAVPGGEVAAEGAVHVIADARPLGAVDLDIADVTQRAGDVIGDVREAEPHLLPLARAAAVALGREQADGGSKAAGQIPARQDVVDRLIQIRRSGDVRPAHARVHRVVDGDRSVRVADDAEHDEVGAPGAERLVREPVAHLEIGEEDSSLRPRRRDERGHQLAPLRIAQIDREGALALVHAGPVDALVLGRDRPTAIVETAAKRVEADHIGPHLGEGHAAEWGCHEGRALDHAEALENTVHARPSSLMPSRPCCGPADGERAV